ncbi:GalNAc(5)-diNAcBac-PP-undecaprenol beta-1,3-glucosyltransferase [Candidatus Brocadiaceae bacterium]|nr:GalNAc(5)-diNAcBac-PP-undecaprenol beta-1,3-glucosyltransferase [Candidatus Brocadiaceae bacterium]
MPLFSVLVPTRNRAHLLSYTLQSILAQDFDDYEIIVSDNESVDNTKQIIESFAEPRVFYIHPAQYLRMHDHWEFARKHARGDYLLFMGDDDCLAGNALSALARVIRERDPAMVGCRSIDYFSNDFWVVAKRNQVRIEKFSGELITVDTHEALVECFRFNPHPYYYPRVTMPVARQLVESIASQVGRFFDYPNPEYVGFSMVYSMIDQFPFLDKPLVVLGRTPDSLGPRYFWTNQDPSWRETTGQPFAFVPLKGTFMTNGAAESFLRAKNNLPNRFEGIEISLVDYYKNYYTDMLTQRWLGRDIRGDLDEFYRVVDSLNRDLRAQVIHSIKDLDLRQPVWHRFMRRSSALLSNAKNLAFHGNHSKVKGKLGDRWFDGNTIGVSDILSCVRWLDNQNNQNLREKV